MFGRRICGRRHLVKPCAMQQYETYFVCILFADIYTYVRESSIIAAHLCQSVFGEVYSMIKSSRRVIDFNQKIKRKRLRMKQNVSFNILPMFGLVICLAVYVCYFGMIGQAKSIDTTRQLEIIGIYRVLYMISPQIGSLPMRKNIGLNMFRNLSQRLNPHIRKNYIIFQSKG